MFELNNDVKFILKSLNDNGYEAYLVGGAVRNFLLGIEPNDYDITTNATPNEIIKVFSFTKTILTGVEFGTVTVVYNHVHYEITTYRIDGKYNDNRHPDEVVFSKTLDNDLKRRDFTVNALAFNNELIDLHDGIADLNNKIIRCIGNPDERFKEDALRILRAIRFSSKLNFNIEEKTKKSIFYNKLLLKKIAFERINVELLEIFKYANINIISEYFDLFTTIFDFLNIKDKDLIIDKIKNLTNNNIKVSELIYCAFFQKVITENIDVDLRKFKLSNDFIHLVITVNNNKINLNDNITVFRKLLKKMSKNDIINYIDYNIFDENKKLHFFKLLDKASEKCNNLKSLAINGNDLINLGYTDTLIGITLNNILDMVIEEKILNDKGVIIEYLLNQR